METNNIDKNIKEKLQNRTINPSVSAWERLSAQLDEQPKQKKKGWFFYVGAAASLLLLISVGFLFLNKSDVIKPSIIIVENPIDTISIDAKIDQFINEIPAEEALVKADEVEEEQVKVSKKKVIDNKVKQAVSNNKVTSSKNPRNVIVNTVVDEKPEHHPTKEKTIKKEILKQDPNSSIKINSDDLLFAVTHSSTEVTEYYAKLNLTREDVLRTIKSELKNSNIKVSPEAILAEVERSIGEEDFQNNFLKSLKRRVTDIATAIASRNN